MIAVDTETRSLRWWEPKQAFLATWAGPDHELAAALVDHPVEGGRVGEGSRLFLEALSLSGTLIAHNAKFDAHMIRENLGYCVFDNGHTVHDTALMSRVLYGRQRVSHGLEDLSRDLLPDGGKGATKASISDVYKTLSGRASMAWDDAYWDVWQENPEALEAYAMADVRDTYDLFELMLPQLEADPRLLAVYELELEVQRVLYHAERRGVRVDPIAVARLKEHHAHLEATAALELIKHLGFLPEGEGSDAQLREALPAAGVPLTEQTETGELSVSRGALAKFEEHPAVAALFAWRRARKFLSTYLAPLDGVEVVHTDYMQAEAWTARMSCRRPNVQNMPKRTDTDPDENLRVRSVFVPREGHSFVVCDFEAIEMRILAHYLGNPAYQQLVAEGDPHAVTAAAIWGGQPEDYYKDTDKRWMRDVAKHTTFAITYGAGGPTVRNTINRMVTEEHRVDVGWTKDPNNQYDTPPQANAIKKKIIGAIPGFDDLAGSTRRKPGSIARQLKKAGYVRTIYGRRQWIPLDKLYVGLSGLVQGSAADVLKLAIVAVEKATRDLGAQQLLFIHDEIVIEVPTENAEECLARARVAMESAIALNPPLAVEGSITEASYAHA